MRRNKSMPSGELPNRKAGVFFVHGFLSLLTGTIGIAGGMAVCLCLVYIHFKIILGLVGFVALIPCLLYYLSSAGKTVVIDTYGVRCYSLFKKYSIPWEDMLCSGYFYHFIYTDNKKKYYYFSKKPIHFKRNPLALDALPPVNENLIYVSEQKGLQEIITQQMGHGTWARRRLMRKKKR